MPAINILGNNRIDDKSFLTTFHDFTAVQHLFFIPQVLAEIEPFMQDESIQSDEPVQLATCYNPCYSSLDLSSIYAVKYHLTTHIHLYQLSFLISTIPSLRYRFPAFLDLPVI